MFRRTLGAIAADRGLIGGPFGSNLVGTDYVSEGVPVIRGINMSGRYISGEHVFVSSEKFARDLRRNSARPGDVLYTQRGTLGQVSIVPEGSYAEYVVSQSQMRLRVNESVANPAYVYYACRTSDFLKQISDNAIATGVPHINLGILSSLSIPVRPLAEQQAIAGVLGAIDDKVAVNTLVGQKSNYLMDAIFFSALAGGSVEHEVGEVAAVFDGPHATPKKTDTGPWFLSISSLQNGRLLLSESTHLSESDFERWTRRVTPSAGDLLFSYETRLGEAVLMPSGVQGCLGRRMGLLRPRTETIGSCVLAHAFRSNSFQETIRQRAVYGATVDRIPLVDLPSWPIELPLNSGGQLESPLAAIHERVEQADRESASLVQLRDTLLPLLMSGRIRVRDAERQVEDAL